MTALPRVTGFSRLLITAPFDLQGTYLLKLPGSEALLTLESTAQTVVNDNFSAWQARSGTGTAIPTTTTTSMA